MALVRKYSKTNYSNTDDLFTIWYSNTSIEILPIAQENKY